MSLTKFDLLRDFKKLETLLPPDFKIEEIPSEGVLSIKYSGKSNVRGADHTHFTNFTSVKCDEEMTVGVWNHPEYFVTIYNQHIGQITMRPNFRKETDFYDVFDNKPSNKMDRRFVLTFIKD
jgi:hypothetical protein